jgi:S-adenosyl methyltransferase
VHDVAQQIAPEVWAAHLESDPVVHVRACTLLTGDGNRGIVLADLRETEALLAHPGGSRSDRLGQTVAVPHIAILHFLTGNEPARAPACIANLAIFRERHRATVQTQQRDPASSADVSYGRPGHNGRLPRLYQHPFSTRPGNGVTVCRIAGRATGRRGRWRRGR